MEGGGAGVERCEKGRAFSFCPPKTVSLRSPPPLPHW